MRTILILTTILIIAAATQADPKLIVHEWGTFTSLQDETGRTIGGINVDDEALPAFVHEIRAPLTYVQSHSKGAGPAARPDVTMRLETPVLYFHPQAGSTVHDVDVKVQFKGGWLTQFYPNAEALIDGVKPGANFTSNPIGADSVSSLAWKKVQFPIDVSIPNTESHVWVAPRKVQAAFISTASEGEKFLFYRGVGHLDAPLVIGRTMVGDNLSIYNRQPWPTSPGPMWLVDILSDGTAAYRAVDAISKHLGDFQATTSAKFAPGEYSDSNIGKLRKDMHAALVQAGLFADEADALLNTWELSYFKSPGERIFFLVPQEWTDAVLPLSISVPSEVHRIMVGRIELVTGRERALINTIASIRPSNPQWMQSGHVQFSQAPADYKAYMGLGRFRDALILDQQRRQPNDNLRQFISNYGLPQSAPQPSSVARSVSDAKPQ
jgi:hypothetical protein